MHRSIGIKRLMAIERRVLPQPLVPGPWQHDTLPEYYWSENPRLLERFEQAKRLFENSPQSDFHGVTLVAGAAGVGKTFLKKHVFDAPDAKTAMCKFDMGELYDAWANQGITADRPDLASGRLVLSRLKSVKDKSQARVRRYMEQHQASFYVIDSLDEIHPDDYTWVLDQIERFVTSCDRPFVHVVVFGRGFAFRDYWARHRARQRPADVALYLLHPPVFRTTGDLMVSSWNYHVWKYHLAWSLDGGPARPMPLEAYRRWAAAGFAHTGPFRTVTCEANDDMRADVQTALVDYASRHPMVASTLYNLAGNSMIREIVRQEVLERRPYDARRIGQAYLDAWLRRETKSHGRPSREQPEQLDLYLTLLRRVAARSLEEGRIDDQGYFPVNETDVVRVAYRGQQRAFSVLRILERSGLIITDPRETHPARYRFEPFWMHRLLVETDGH